MKKSLLFLVPFLSCALAFGQPATIDDSFHYNATGSSGVVVTQPDGKVIIKTGPTEIVRLTASGTVDPTFNVGTGFNDGVASIVLQPDGKILVGGIFSNFNGTSCKGIVRLTSVGGYDPTFTPPQTQFLGNIALQSDGKILIWEDGILRRLQSNGTVDATFSATPIQILFGFFRVLSSGKILACELSPKLKIHRLNSDGTEDPTFNPAGAGPDGIVTSIEVQTDNKLIIGGGFSTYNGVGRNKLARLNADGTLDATYNPGSGFIGSVSSVIRQSNNQMLVVGSFTSFNGVARKGLARINTNGTLDATFDPGAGFVGAAGYANRIFLRPNESIFCTGSFASYNGTPKAGLVCLKNDGSGMIPEGNQVILNGCSPNPITLTGPLTGATYQWYSRVGIITEAPVVNSVAGWAAITGASANTYAPGPLAASASYACRVTFNGKTNWAYGVRAIFVNAMDSKGTLTSANQTLTSPADPAIITFASLPTYSVSGTYQWYYKDGAAAQPIGNSTTGWTLIPGATIKTYDPPAGLTVSRSYAVLHTYNPSGACPTIGWATGVRKITISTGGVVNSPGTLASGNETICYSGNPVIINFSTVATGTSLTYQWYYKNGLIAAPTGTTTTGWSLITGATASSYDPPTGLIQSRSFACFVKAGTTTIGWASGVRQITVLNPFYPGILASGDQTLCANGNPANITMALPPAGGSATGQYSYRWYYKESVVAQCPGEIDPTTGWTATSSSANSYDPQSAGANGRTFALRIIPIGVGCFPPSWAFGCRKITVTPCREVVYGNTDISETPELILAEKPALLGNVPNPASDNTLISCFIPSQGQSAEIRIVNSLGQEVDRIPVEGEGNQQINVSLARYPNGLFTYSLILNGKVEAIQRLIVVK